MSQEIIQYNKVRAKKLKRNAYKFNHISCFSEDGYAFATKESDSTWCIIDLEGNIISETKNAYWYHGEFNQGLSVVSKHDNTFGVIDIYGNTVIEFEYEHISGFENGLAVADIGDSRRCIINTKGEIVFPDKYEGLSFNLKDGIGAFMYKPNRMDYNYREQGLVDIEGNELKFNSTSIVSLNYESIKELLNQEPIEVKRISDIIPDEKFLYSIRKDNINGRDLFRVDKDFNRTKYHIVGNLLKIDENIFHVERYFFDKKAKGYCNIHGKMLIESTEFDSISSFENGFGVVGAMKDKNDYRTFRYNFINKDGKFGSKVNYDSIYPLPLSREHSYKKDLASVSKGKYKGLINSNGELLVPCKYKTVMVVYHGVAVCYGFDKTITIELF